MAKVTISTIPEELRQGIIRYLAYADAWSLKQTSTLFYRIVEIPTLKSFLACPDGLSLEVLEERPSIIPRGREICFHCKRLLPREKFSLFQRYLSRSRQHLWFRFDYATWNPEKHYCLDCGVKHRRYPSGKMVYIDGRGAIGTGGICGFLVNCEPGGLGICPECNGPLCADEHRPRWVRNTSSSDVHRDLGVADDEQTFEEATEPEPRLYYNALSESILALAGERLLS
ncbi:hypothetical protein IMSHALPRED_006401 [Imshaugia aleurites]|uniref:F-box domain-containing protein n=1 Tax=Imshaugia aleurites TaxID=172621 RepID=A0A8H3FIJ4_9LECA|nr:hypothetical protein IMSHALPRED_006401 [Imshaugia aleurites]